MKTKIDNFSIVANAISTWLTTYALNSGSKGFTIGISGGIDSAVTSTLCARTGYPLLVIEMPIHQGTDEVNRAKKHIDWLKENFPNVTSMKIDLTQTYDTLYDAYLKQSGTTVSKETFDFAMANTRSRLRMVTLYQFAGINKYLVAGTGNKVEDFGIGFYTKYGDGGVDISPIADLMKSEVYALGAELGIAKEILSAAPTDGLHTDGRTDEDQIGATYDELEWAMDWISDNTVIDQGVGSYYDDRDEKSLSERQLKVLEIYKNFNTSNKHKMNPIPTFSAFSYRK